MLVSDNELRELYRQSDQLTGEREKLRALERLSTLAQSSHDVNLASEIYFATVKAAVINTLKNTRDGFRSFILAFGRLRTLQAEHKDVISEKTVFACHKFLFLIYASDPRLSRSSSLALLNEMESLRLVLGAPKSIVAFARAMRAFSLGEIENGVTFSEEFDLSEPSSSEHPCRGCMNSFLVPVLLWHLPNERSVRIAEAFNRDRFSYDGRCSDKSEVDFALMAPLVRTGRREDARDIYRRCRDKVLDGYADVPDAASTLRYFASLGEGRTNKTDLELGLSIIERYALKAAETKTSFAALDYYCGVLAYCSSLPTKLSSKQMRFPAAFRSKTGRDSTTIGQYQEWALSEAIGLAKKFDQRNGNQYYSKLVMTIVACRSGV